MFTNYQEAVEWINSLVKLGIKPGLQRMERLMEAFDYPHRRLKFIHVAGTNGKGSVCAMLDSVLRQCGYDVGVFTSPYMGKFTNRIQFNGQEISEEDVLNLCNQIKPAVDEIALSPLGSPTMFEVVTTLAILYFANVTYPYYVVWETGLGGRLDSTNIVVPVVSVITNIGEDHTEILGERLADIAREKAGIIKSGVPVVSAASQPEAIEILERTAKEKKATLYLLNRQYKYEPVSAEADKQRMNFYGPFRSITEVPVSLSGAHQLENAAVTLMTLEVLRQFYAAILEDEDLLKGMESAKWPGRLELISAEPRILLDGAHNPPGARVLAAALKDLYRYEKLHFMVGMLETKNHYSYLKHILPLVNTLIVTEPDFRKKADAARLGEIASQLAQESGHTLDIIVEPDWKTALERLIGLTQPDDLAVVSGTLYLVSDVRSRLLDHSLFEKGW